MLKKFYIALAFLVAAFIGGVIWPMCLSWLKPSIVTVPADAVSIANTYIVFTTLIFVGVTVILAVAGYVFTQQFSSQKGNQELAILEELKQRIKSEERIGISLGDAILENPDLIRHIETKFKEKIEELIRNATSEAKARKESAEAECDAISKLQDQLGK
jgi:uncharacterized protein HemX